MHAKSRVSTHINPYKLAACVHIITIYLFTLQTFGNCYNSYNLSLVFYPELQMVTKDLLQNFYNGLILHRRFITEVMLVELKLLRITGQRDIHYSLHSIKNQLEHNIVRLFHLVSIS